MTPGAGVIVDLEDSTDGPVVADSSHGGSRPAPEDRHAAAVTTTGPEVVTLCGSTRFRDAFEREQRRLTLEGRIVISVGLWGDEERLDQSSQVKVDLDELHRRKIDISQRIHVINVGGYIGSSTRGEIEYAQRRGIAVTHLEP